MVKLIEFYLGTNVDEAIGICHAICEQLSGSKVLVNRMMVTIADLADCLIIGIRFAISKAFTFLATHFRKLTDLEAMYPNVMK